MSGWQQTAPDPDPEWRPVGSVKGPKGDPGPPGTPGQPGDAVVPDLPDLTILLENALT